MTGTFPRFRLRAQRDGRVEQPLPRPVQRHHLRLGVEAHAIPPRDPVGHGAAQLRRALVRRILPEIGGMVGYHLRDPRRECVARLADGHLDDLATRRMRVEKPPQTRKGILRQVRKPLGKNHRRLGPGSCRPVRGNTTPAAPAGPPEQRPPREPPPPPVAFTPEPPPPPRQVAEAAPPPWGAP